MKAVTIRIPDDLHAKAKDEAWRARTSINSWILNAIKAKLKEAAMTHEIQITIYPAHMTQETTSHEYLHDAAARFANELTPKIREAYSDAELNIDIKPAGDTGFNGGPSCDNAEIAEHVQYLYDQTFNQGGFWPEMTGHCVYCGHETYITDVPAYDDDEAWADIALEHAEDCEWVLTRAHQIEKED